MNANADHIYGMTTYLNDLNSIPLLVNETDKNRKTNKLFELIAAQGHTEGYRCYSSWNDGGAPLRTPVVEHYVGCCPVKANLWFCWCNGNPKVENNWMHYTGCCSLLGISFGCCKSRTCEIWNANRVLALLQNRVYRTCCPCDRLCRET